MSDIKVDVRGLGEPWFVDEKDDIWLMYDEIVIAWHPILGKVCIQYLFKEECVHTEPVEGHPGFVDPAGIIHMTGLVGRVRLNFPSP